MAKRKKKESFWSKLAFWNQRKKRTKKQVQETVASIKRGSIVLGIILSFASVAVGFKLMESYVNTSLGRQNAQLVLVDQPEWLSIDFQKQISEVAGGLLVSYDQNTPRIVSQALDRQLDWMYNVHVQVYGSSLRINASYRKPIAWINSTGSELKYLSWISDKYDPLYSEIEDRVAVMDYVVLENIPLVKIEGFRGPVPDEGIWPSGEIISAVELVWRLGLMDEISSPDKPLLNELSTIDISNYEGRKNKNQPHVIIETKNGTVIKWGAAYGQGAQYGEALEQEKIAALYTHYKAFGTSKGNLKFIDLQKPHKLLPRETSP